MEPLARILHRVLGRTRFGLYAITGDDEARPFLVAGSAGWPVSNSDPIAMLQSTLRSDGLPAGCLRRASNLALLPLGRPGKLSGALLIHAGSRASVWRRNAGEWAGLAELLDAGLERRALGDEIHSLRRFYDLLLSNLPLGVLTLDHRGRVTYLSPPAEAILGHRCDSAVGVDGQEIFRVTGTDESPLLLGLKGKATTAELYVTDRAGRDKPLWVQMTRVPGGAGSPGPGLLVLMRDTTEERSFEEEMRQRERLASIGELAAGVAHEIRNPLTGIGNCAQVLRDRLTVEDPRQRFVQIILEEAARLNRIVESLLSFARPGRPRLRESDVVATCEHVVELERERFAEQGVQCDLRIRGRIPRIFIDPEQITQVLLNIVRNGLEAMAGGGHLTLECAVIRRRPHLRRGTGQRKTDRVRYAREGPLLRYVQLKVTDTGGGIPRDVLPRIFDPFFTTRPKGTGLGLSITQSIVREHGGFISVRSIEGKGTVIAIDLPIERRQGERRGNHG